MRVIRAPYRYFAKNVGITFSLLAGVLALLALAAITRETVDTPRALVVVLVVAQVAPLGALRRTPSGVLLATSGGLFGAYALGLPPTVAIVGPAIAAYWAVTRERRPWGARTVLACGVAALAAPFVHDGNTTADDFFLVLFAYGLPWLIGSRIRTSREYTAGLEQRTALLELEREQQAREAVAAERARIARELHDVVAHAVSVAVVQAGAAGRVLETDPARARAHVATIESTGRLAMAELRRLLGVLRPEGGDGGGLFAPQPGVGDLAGLVQQMREAGLPVELEIEGEARPLPTSLDLSAYRIVQESLTNTLRHAGPAHARVTLRYHTDVLELAIADDGHGASDRSARQGHGLVGMRERAALFGGSLEAGTPVEGGYRVVARLPLDTPSL